ncbi:arylformamidase [Priestia filamentosa]|uniref:arylformamidase n=1 Tax=Priestia filamentosa TaxID=1402861 RepID=UPI002E214A13|nr:arylformamidase [Priestia filamentosa]
MWIDVSQRLDNNIAVWPGDTPFSYEVDVSKEESGSVNIGKLTLSTHTGTHIDAPFHFDNEGKKVIDLDINLYIGSAVVVHLPNRQLIEKEELEKLNLDNVTRLLIRTDAWQNRTVYPEEIPTLESEAIDYLASIGVLLIGFDLPSVDHMKSKTLPNHHKLASSGIHILEGLILDDIPSGHYQLIALPLPLIEGDGSPVRALLKKEKN